ncbi:MAG: hypothetical protein V4505_20715 [Pseudomonadota bacterium]
MAHLHNPGYPNVNAHTLAGVARAAEFIDQLAALLHGALRVVGLTSLAGRARR